jgi:hypothetical protein
MSRSPVARNPIARTRVLALLLAGAISSFLPAPADASFHFMQVEQIVGGICGDTKAQVIQLRMRAAGQNLVSGARLIATNAAGASPVTLLIIPANVANSAAGARILIASPAAAAMLTGEDFTMTASIPASYLAAGRLVFTDPPGTTVYWSVSWGGASYTGSNAGATDNDADGNFGPSFPTRLRSTSSQGLQFLFAAAALSMNNAADYANTTDDATFFNNAGAAVTLSADCVFGDDFEVGSSGLWALQSP